MGAVFESSAAHVASTSRWIGGSCPLPSSVSVGVFAFALLTNRDRHASACGGAARGVGPVGEEGSEHMVTRPDEVVVEEEEEIEEMDDNVPDSAFAEGYRIHKNLRDAGHPKLQLTGRKNG